MGKLNKLGSDGKLENIEGQIENIGMYKLDRPIENIGMYKLYKI